MDGKGRISPKETSEEYVSELYLTYGPKLVRMAHSMLHDFHRAEDCLLYTSPSPRDGATSRMPSSA